MTNRCSAGSKSARPRPPNPWNARSWTFRTISPTPCMTSRIPSPPARSSDCARRSEDAGPHHRADARMVWGEVGCRQALLAAFMRLRRAFVPAHFNGSRESLLWQEHHVDLISRFCWSVKPPRATYGPGPLTRYSSNIVIPGGTNYEIVALKGIAVYFVMAPREREPFHQEELKRSYRIWSMCLWPIRRSHPTLWKASSWPIGMNPPMTTSACASPSIRSQA